MPGLKIRDNHNHTGNDRKKSKFYNRINKILGNGPSVTPSIVWDTLDWSTSSEKLLQKKEQGNLRKTQADEEDPHNNLNQAVNTISRQYC